VAVLPGFALLIPGYALLIPGYALLIPGYALTPLIPQLAPRQLDE
jgi:hypothetical protein